MAEPDLSEFERLSQPRRRPCPLAAVLRELKGPDSASLKAALASDKNVITSSAISQWLERRGHKVNGQSISCHRRSVCSCHDE